MPTTLHAALAGLASLPVAELPLQAGVSETPMGRLLIAIVVLLVIVFVGRFVLAIAWRLLLVAAVVVGILYAVSVVTI